MKELGKEIVLLLVDEDKKQGLLNVDHLMELLLIRDIVVVVVLNQVQVDLVIRRLVYVNEQSQVML